ncbi:MAG: flippase [Patescibacteria group bacterium]|nr:flippase [Patescibacteria group bacterium]
MYKKIKSFLFENQSLKQTIAKNTFWLFFGQVSGRFVRMGLIIFAARVLGPSSWGAFSYVMTLVAFMTIFSDIGMGAIVTRESAKTPEHSKRYFSTAFCLKLILLAIGILILIFGAPYITNIPEAKKLMPVVSLILLFDSLRNFGFVISRAKEKMQYEALNEILTNFFITAFGMFFLFLSPNSESLAIGYLLGVAVGFLGIFFLLKDHFTASFSEFDPLLVWPLLKSSLPFALASFLGSIMLNTDLVIIGWMRPAAETGYYSAAQKPIYVLYTMASLFAVSIFPALTKTLKEGLEGGKKVLEKAVAASFLAAIPIALGGIILGSQIIDLVFGKEYQPATLSFQILMSTILIIFPSAIVSNSVLAHEKQKNFITFSMIGAIGNIIFDLLLIPRWGIGGSSVATLLTQIVSNYFIWHKMQIANPFSVFPNIKKMIVAGIVMAALTYLMEIAGIPLLINILISIIIYLLTLKIQKEKLLELIRR